MCRRGAAAACDSSAGVATPRHSRQTHRCQLSTSVLLLPNTPAFRPVQTDCTLVSSSSSFRTTGRNRSRSTVRRLKVGEHVWPAPLIRGGSGGRGGSSTGGGEVDRRRGSAACPLPQPLLCRSSPVRLLLCVGPRNQNSGRCRRRGPVAGSPSARQSRAAVSAVSGVDRPVDCIAGALERVRSPAGSSANRGPSQLAVCRTSSFGRVPKGEWRGQDGQHSAEQQQRKRRFIIPGSGSGIY